MAWTVTCSEQDGKEYAGTATATWNAGEPDEFRFSATGDATPEVLARFAEIAVKARDEAALKREREAEVATAIATLLNEE